LGFNQRLLIEAEEARRRISPTFQKQLQAEMMRKKKEEKARLAAELKAKLKEEKLQREGKYSRKLIILKFQTIYYLEKLEKKKREWKEKSERLRKRCKCVA
jgi:hypothetical protein